ncbi:hypothetical protein Bhyg_07882 [Pseudolycoriella hygida]|uniref:Transmembrane protein n=1 Tax=Pseudolycoriella hygida TaxID=35572 RepID=A0A9Q0N4G9_9DIPT|nr:hypothetical protein Bhyg_07882 [Pseudolycoriella hygida]
MLCLDLCFTSKFFMSINWQRQRQRYSIANDNHLKASYSMSIRAFQKIQFLLLIFFVFLTLFHLDDSFDNCIVQQHHTTFIHYFVSTFVLSITVYLLFMAATFVPGRYRLFDNVFNQFYQCL